MKRFFHLLPLFAVVLKVSGATFTVTSANDSGTGSLRQAILDANSSSDRDTIEFNIPARPGFVIVPTIKPLSPLPTITQPVTIDGTTQPAGKVALDGSSAGATAAGLRITAGGCEIMGLVIERFGGNGIELVGPRGGNTIGECFIGTDISGRVAQGNGGDGVFISNSAANHIGRPPIVIRPGFPSLPALTNWISANTRNGIEISGAGSSNNIVANNRIGLDVSGAAALGNSADGVLILDGALGNTIGGSLVDSRNIISGNGSNGLHLASQGVTNFATLSSTDVPKVLALNPQDPVPTNGFVYQTNVSILNIANEDPVIDLDVEVDLTYRPIGGVDLSITGPTGTTVSLCDSSSFQDTLGFDNGYGSNFSGTIFDEQSTEYLAYHTAPYTGRFKPWRFFPPDVLSAFNFLSPQGQWTLSIGIFRSFFFQDGTGGYGIIETNTATLLSWSLLLTKVHGNEVTGNFIGTDASGQAALGNAAAGVFISGSSGNRIGGSRSSDRNVISANQLDGVHISSSSAAVNLVLGNLIGTDAGGTHALGNGVNGVELSGAINASIGGAFPGYGNVIAASSSAGVALNAGARHNRVQGNFIGTDPTATLDLGNATNGVQITSSASENLIGGTVYITAGDYVYLASGANSIGFSGADAIWIAAGDLRFDPVANHISANNFVSNRGRAIHYGGRLSLAPLAPPALGSVIRDTERAVVSDVTATPATSFQVYEIDFYLSDTADIADSGQRETFLVGFTAAIDSNGHVSDYDNLRDIFSIRDIPTPALTNFFRATLTDTQGNTSEFSLGAPVSPGSYATVYPHINDGRRVDYYLGYAQVGQPLSLDFNVFNIGPDPEPDFVLSNRLGTGMQLLGATSTQGTSSTINDAIVFNLGAIAVGPGPADIFLESNATARATMQVVPTIAGKVTNTYSFSSPTHPRSFSQNVLLVVRDPVSWRQQLDADGFKLFVPTNAAPFEVRYTDSLSPPITWKRIFQILPPPVGDQFILTNRVDSPARFFRLILEGSFF